MVATFVRHCVAHEQGSERAVNKQAQRYDLGDSSRKGNLRTFRRLESLVCRIRRVPLVGR